ncbi:MAG: ribbon-helix-helix domain-containing protein [Thermoplasmatota archaeon]
MTEVQILFRIEKDMIEELDKHLADFGYKTRNEWFRNKVREYVTEVEKKRMMDKLDKLTVEGITEEEIVEMVRDWRKRSMEGEGK